MSTDDVSPFVIGQWVRGDKFFGRAALIDEILTGNRNSLSVVGTRRIGKTSLLKQIELLSRLEGRFFPIFWDLQGIESADEIAMGFHDALLDVEDHLGDLNFDIPVDHGDVFSTLKVLKRTIRRKDRTLLLLCDEAEELLSLHRKEPALIRKLHRALTEEGIRTILASTVRLWDVSRADESFPFLEGFTPPVYLGRFSSSESEELIHQQKTGARRKARFAPDATSLIRSRSGDHPYLLQLLCKRYVDLNDLDEAIEHVFHDPMTRTLIHVDLSSLTTTEQDILRFLSSDRPGSDAVWPGPITADSASLSAALRRLTDLGFIETSRDGRRTLRGDLFRRWLVSSEESHQSSNETVPTRKGLRVGDWFAIPELNMLEKDQVEVRLEPRVMNLLVFLARRKGEVASKDDIIDEVWDGQIISESALTRTIADLRKALGDNARNPTYLETISKRGYRLVAPIVWLNQSGQKQPAKGLETPFAITWRERIESFSEGEHVIGRDTDCFLCISSGKVSRRHARIVVSEGQAILEDLGSRNGTWLNGRRIAGPERLTEGDEISIGRETLMFRDSSSPIATQTDMGVPGNQEESDR